MGGPRLPKFVGVCVCVCVCVWVCLGIQTGDL